MTILDVLNEILEVLADHSDFLIGYEQSRFWPKEATAVLSHAGLLQQADLAQEVECWKCPEACPVDVTIYSGDTGNPVRAVMGCNERADMGTSDVPLFRLEQWRTDRNLFARWIADTLTLRYSGKHLDGGNLLELGLFSGDKRAQMLCLHTDGELALVAGSNSIPLIDAIQWIDGGLALDADLIRQLVDSATTGDARYTPNTARREVRKLETAAMHEQWRKEYRALKKRRPNMSDVWYSQQIGKMECAQGRKAGTIKKNMK